MLGKFISSYLLWALCAFSLHVGATPLDQLREGDLIFQKSDTEQARAIAEATASPWTHVGILMSEKSRWYVVEAVQPVRVSTLEAFIKRGIRREHRVYRHALFEQADSKSALQALRRELGNYIGRSYDIYFEWSDDRIYCSELVFKAFYRALGVQVGKIQKFKDLYLDGYYVKKLIKDRLESIGKELDLEQPIVTPVSQINEPALRLVYRSH